MSKTLEFLSLLDLVYGAALDGELQPEMLSSIRKLFDGDVAFYNVHDADRNVGSMQVADGLAAEDVAEYHELSALNERIRGAVERYRPGSAASGEDIVGAAAWKHSEFYSRWAKQRDYVHDIGCIVEQSGNVGAALVVGRGNRGRAYTRADAHRLEALVPHLRRAIEIRNRLQLERSNVQLAWDTLDRLRVGVALLDAGAHAVFANTALRGICAQQDGLVLRNGMLSAIHYRTNQTLQGLVSETCDPEALTKNSAFRLIVPRSNGSRGYSLSLSPLRLPQAPLGVRIPSTIVFVQDPQDVADGVDVLFQHRYGLTQAELAVVAALLRGETLREFAERSSRSLNTLRVLVKRAFAKTGTRTQAQLVRIAMEDIVFRSFINI